MTNPEFYQGGDDYLIQQQEIFHEKIYLNQLLIDELDAKDEFTNEIAQEISKDLDQCCPYFLQPVLISGRALVPVIDQEQMKIVGEEWSEVAVEGIHEGVDVIEIEEGGYMLAQRAKLGDIFIKHGRTCAGMVGLYGYFTNEANITPILEIENNFNPYYLSSNHSDDDSRMESFQLLSEKSARLVKLLGTSRFLRLGKARQHRLIDDFVVETSQQVSVAEYQVAVAAEYGYVTELTEDNRLALGKVALEGRPVYGICVAIDSLERICLQKEKIKSDQQLLDREAGLCLVIDPDNDSRNDLELNETQVLYVPLSSQELELELLDTDD